MVRQKRARPDDGEEDLVVDSGNKRRFPGPQIGITQQNQMVEVIEIDDEDEVIEVSQSIFN